jgi:hypothetical protein
MPIGTDFEVQADGDIRHVANTTTYTVLEFHRWLQDLADDAVATGDDILDITDLTPSERSTDNIIRLNAPYNIDDTAAQFLYDGSITQSGGDTVYSGLVVVGAVETGTELQIIQNNAILTSYWGTGLNANAAANILLRIMVKTRDAGADIDGKRIRVQARELGDTYSEFSATLGEGNSTAAIFTSVDLNNETIAGTIAGWTISNTEGYQLLEINGTAPAEPYYSQWDPGTQTINDLYEYAKWIQRRGTSETIHGLNGFLFRGITGQFDYDGESNAFTEDDIIAWGTSFAYDGETGAGLIVGDRVENTTVGGAGTVVYVQDAGTTGTVVIARESFTATWADNNVITKVANAGGGVLTAGSVTVAGAVSDGTASGGTAKLLALLDSGTTGTVWFQLLTGSNPVNNLPIYQQGDTGVRALVNGSITARTISPAFIGVSTGSAIIGAFGIGIKPSELTASDLLFDLTNTPQTPPNNVTFTVGGLESGEDRVLVGPESGGLLNTAQFTLSTTLSAASETAVVVGTAIPSDTPASGTIRVELDNGVYKRVPYTSWSGSTFNITVGPEDDFTGVNATAGNDVFISYIDKLADAATATFTSVFLSPRSLFIRVRDGGTAGDFEGIKTFETTGTLGSAGGSTTAIRTSDA